MNDLVNRLTGEAGWGMSQFGCGGGGVVSYLGISLGVPRTVVQSFTVHPCQIRLTLQYLLLLGLEKG